MRDPILVAVLDSFIQVGVGLLILVMALGWGVTLVQLYDARKDLRDVEAMRLGPKVRAGLHRIAAARPAPPAFAQANPWLRDDGTTSRTAPWHLQWEQPPPVVPVPWSAPDPATRYEAGHPAHGDVADDLEQIADLWHDNAAATPPDPVTLAELGERWIAANEPDAEIPPPSEGEEGPPEHQGPDAVQEAAGEEGTTPVSAPIPWAAEHSWPPAASFPVEKPAEPPVTSGGPAAQDQVEPPAPNLADMWVGLAAQDLAG